MKKLIFNGKSSEDLGVVIQNTPNYSYPERDIETTHIPGRNGDIVIDNKCYKNIQRQYNLAKCNFQINGFSYNTESLVSWLTEPRGKYCRLEDDYDPEVYRLAYYNEGTSVVNYFDQALAVSVTFNCKPQRYLKSGEIPIRYTGNEAIIVNPTVYDSLPKIKMEGIPNDQSKVYLITILDNDGNETSSLSFSKIDNGYFYIDSDTQNCYDDLGDINEKVGLNGNEFPILKPKTNKIKVASYETVNSNIPQYNSVIQKAQNVVKSEYKTFDILVDDNQDRRNIQPYKSLISKAQEVYEAKSYQTYAEEIGYSYKFNSFNTLLKNFGQQVAFNGKYDKNILSSYDWFNADKSTDNEIYTAKDGFFMTSDTNSTIKFIHSGEKILSVNVNGNNSITYYESKDGNLAIQYTDIPVDDNGNKWVDYEIKYVNGKPTQLIYKAMQNGYYWTDKTWWLGKAKWRYCNAGDILTTLAWNTSSKAFMNTEGLSVSTTTTYLYKFMPVDSNKNIMQYEKIYDEISDITHNVYFKVSDVSSGTLTDKSLGSISVTATKAGYFKMVHGNKEYDEVIWAHYNVGDQIGGEYLKGTEPFTIYYIEAAPEYEYKSDDDKSFPNWLNKRPITIISGTNCEDDKSLLNAKLITFKVKEGSNYRIEYLDKDNNTVKNEFVRINSGDILKTKKKDSNEYVYEISVSSSFWVAKLDKVPEENEHKRLYRYSNDTQEVEPPEWLDVEYAIDEKKKSESKAKEEDYTAIYYHVNRAGYYRFNSNPAWQQFTENDITGKETKDKPILFTTGFKDNSDIYYMEELPKYEDYGGYKLHEYLEYNIIKVLGNPTEVEIKIKEGGEGYYRVNYDSDWKWFKSGSTLFKATVNQVTTIYRLVEDQTVDLSEMKIEITPNWWIL